MAVNIPKRRGGFGPFHRVQKQQLRVEIITRYITNILDGFLDRYDYRYSTLMRAIYYEAPTNIIKLVIDKGVKDLLMMKDNMIEEWTALHWACYGGASMEVVKILLDAGGDDLIGMKDNNGDTVMDDEDYLDGTSATKGDSSGEVKEAVKDAITSTFHKDLQSSPNSSITHPRLDLFIERHGIEGFFSLQN